MHNKNIIHNFHINKQNFTVDSLQFGHLAPKYYEDFGTKSVKKED